MKDIFRNKISHLSECPIQLKFFTIFTSFIVHGRAFNRTIEFFCCIRRLLLFQHFFHWFGHCFDFRLKENFRWFLWSTQNYSGKANKQKSNHEIIANIELLRLHGPQNRCIDHWLSLSIGWYHKCYIAWQPLGHVRLVQKDYIFDSASEIVVKLVGLTSKIKN